MHSAISFESSMHKESLSKASLWQMSIFKLHKSSSNETLKTALGLQHRVGAYSSPCLRTISLLFGPYGTPWYFSFEHRLFSANVRS